MDKVAEGFSCHGEYVEKEEEIGPTIARAYASGKGRRGARLHRPQGQLGGDAEV